MPYATANGIRLFYESLGEGTPLILQAHDHSPWLFFQAPFFSQRYRFITFDRRGTGRSDDPPGPWSIGDFAADAAGLMDALAIDRAIVGGGSLGGAITAQFALDHPGRALALIIGHTVPYLWPLGLQWIDGLISAAKQGRTRLVEQPRSSESEASGPPTTDPEFAASEIGRLLASVGTGLGRTPGAVIKMHEALRGFDQRPRYGELRRLTVPALVIVGEREPASTIELAREWHEQMPSSEFAIVPGAHHAAPREAPLRWNGIVDAFLARRLDTRSAPSAGLGGAR